LATQAGGQGANRQCLEAIADRIRSSSQKERKFGLQVAALLERFGLPDETIIDAHYQSKAPGMNRTWAGLLSDYRGAVVHKGYLDIVRGVYDPNRVSQTVTGHSIVASE
jgi:hypothetical protein